MPVAVTSGNETTRFDLKTAPPDGFVVIRRMTYGEFLRRRQMSSNMKLDINRNDTSGVMELLNQAAIEYEFANCITDHNLTDTDGRKLNFHRESDIQKLDPRIGEEINTRINEVNTFEESEEEVEGNSGTGSELASLET